MKLENLPPDVIGLLGECFVGTVEPAGLRGVSVVAREISQLAQSSRTFLPLVVKAWETLRDQTPALFHQFDVNDILEKHGCLHLLGQQTIRGPVNLCNFTSNAPRKHSPGLHALGWLEKDSLDRYLSQTDGPLAPPLPLRSSLMGVRAPVEVRVTVAVEKCQHSWRTPSPAWTRLEISGIRQLETIDMVRELLTDRPDRGLVHDEEMTSLLSQHFSDWPYGEYNRNTWWGFRKLICDTWSPIDIQTKQQMRRKAAHVCLHCLGPAHNQCPQFCCTKCCSAMRLQCWLHNPRAPWQARRLKRHAPTGIEGP